MTTLSIVLICILCYIIIGMLCILIDAFWSVCSNGSDVLFVILLWPVFVSIAIAGLFVNVYDKLKYFYYKHKYSDEYLEQKYSDNNAKTK